MLIPRTIVGGINCFVSLIAGVMPWIFLSLFFSVPMSSYIVYASVLLDEAMMQALSSGQINVPMMPPNFLTVQRVILASSVASTWSALQYMSEMNNTKTIWMLIYGPSLAYFSCSLIFDILMLFIINVGRGLTYDEFLSVLSRDIDTLMTKKKEGAEDKKTN